MSTTASVPAPEVFSFHEIGRAASATAAEVRFAADSAGIPVLHGRFVLLQDAVRLLDVLRRRGTSQAEPPRLFAPAALTERRPAMSVATAAALHAGLLGVLIVIGTHGVGTAPVERPPVELTRLVFVTTPGPGGGGGGGGLRQSEHPPAARLKGRSALTSPVTVQRRAAKPAPVERVSTPTPVIARNPEPVAPPPPAPAPPAPPVVAPVVSAPADMEDRAGLPASTPRADTAESHGPGTGGGIGSGTGTGAGPGSGTGIGDGSIAGTGGGPYRPGSGVAAPSLLREVKPVYTEEGRRRSVEGEVVMEVVVRADGSVGTVRVLRGLGSGLDQRAVEAVRQWRFLPARRHGAPVDVLVEIAVEFRLR